MSRRVGILLRPISKMECPWLENDLIAGTSVFEYLGRTYGCITKDGEAVCLDPHDDLFTEVPSSAIGWWQ